MADPHAAEEAFFALLRPEQGKLYRTALAILGNEADARDALQEAVIRAYRAFAQLKGGPASFPAWMRRILVNQCTHILRRRAKVIPVEQPMDLRPDPERVQEMPEGSEVWEAVRRLPEHYRAVVVLRFLDDMSLEDIAAALDIPLGTVKSRLHTALRLLRQWLTPAGERRGAL